MKVYGNILLASLAASLTLLTAPSMAQDAKGWDRTVRVADYLEPAIPHQAQEQAAPRTNCGSLRRRPAASQTS